MAPDPVVLNDVPHLRETLGLEAGDVVEWWARRQTQWQEVTLNHKFFMGLDRLICLRKPRRVKWCPDYQVYFNLLEAPMAPGVAPDPEDVIDDVIIKL